jgi:hypothetical protein
MDRYIGEVIALFIPSHNYLIHYYISMPNTKSKNGHQIICSCTRGFIHSSAALTQVSRGLRAALISYRTKTNSLSFGDTPPLCLRHPRHLLRTMRPRPSPLATRNENYEEWESIPSSPPSAHVQQPTPAINEPEERPFHFL